jgi:hypothetical protein
MALPLTEAYNQYKKEELSWQDYVHNIFRLVEGYPHKDDIIFNHKDDVSPVEYDDLRKTDLFAYSIWHWHRPRTCIQSLYHLSTIENTFLTGSIDTIPMETVFIAYRHESPGEVNRLLGLLEDDAQTGMRQALAALGLRERRADVLKMCLDHGFPYEEYFERAANFVKRESSPKTFQVIEESDFRKKNPRSKKPRNPHPLW